MITIFNGRSFGLDGQKSSIYVQLAVTMREHIGEFNTGKSLTPFAVFMEIALHTNEMGWAWPSHDTIMRNLKLGTRNAVAAAITHLQNMRIDGKRVLDAWQERRPDGTMGRALYRIFPDAWTDAFESAPITPKRPKGYTVTTIAEIAKGARTSIDYDVALASADLATVHRRASPVTAWAL